MATDKKELWVGWTLAAMSKYTPPEGKLDEDELVDDMVDVTIKYADQMLEEYEDRFGDDAPARARRRKKPKDEEEEETED